MRNLQEIESALGSIFGVSEVTNIRERVVVSPAKGRFHPHPPEIFTTEGEWVEKGQVLARISNGAESIPVVCAFTGWMMGMLALAGQPVAAGDQLFWIRS
jgi:biotin carboxyl carrier protein